MPHITVIARPPDDETISDQETVYSETPVRTNPSYLTETDAGLDLHLRTSQTDNFNHQATFADIARVGLGPQRDLHADQMASHEPIPLHHYMKFKKPRNRKGTYSPIDENIEGMVLKQVEMMAV
jgi:hypothetical protein